MHRRANMLYCHCDRCLMVQCFELSG